LYVLSTQGDNGLYRATVKQHNRRRITKSHRATVG